MLPWQSDKLPEDGAGVGKVIPLALQCQQITAGLPVATGKMRNGTKSADFIGAEHSFTSGAGGAEVNQDTSF